MLLIKKLLDDLYPEIKEIQDYSILCLITSNPVYLIFNNTSETPEFVIHAVVNNNKINDVYKKHQELYLLLGDMIAQPLHLIEKNNQTYFIEKGLQGLPWFQLANNYQSTQEWNHIKNQASTTLKSFHQGILQSTFGPQQINLGESLRLQYQQSLKFNTNLPKELESKVELYAKQLDQLGIVDSFSQHGDYCLNNLLFDTNTTHIIDFEDIGMTVAPLHDEFSLALSFYSLADNNRKDSLQEEIDFCLAHSYWKDTFSEEIISGLFLHHLLLRLGHWSHDKKRNEFKKWLLQILKENRF